MTSEQIDAVRSRIMRAVRQKRTNPEMTVRSALHAEGYRFRTNLRRLPGSPDIVFTARRKVVFIHGCFWHRHPACRLASAPKTRTDFWEAKFLANIERDAGNVNELMDLGWEVATIWECETRELPRTTARLREFLGPPRYAV